MFYEEKKSELTFYKSSLIDESKVIHAFTTRTGGNTPDPMATFSLGTSGYSELKNYVEENRKRVCDVLGLNSEKIIIPDQKHTNNIKVVSNVNDDVANTDGLITAIPGLVLMLLFADCTPIILHATDKNILGVIHAGWRGTAKKIAQEAIRIMVTQFNVDAKQVKACIGQAIGSCCYEVSLEVAEELKTSVNENHANIFINSPNDKEKILVDLKRLNAQQLLEMGVREIDVIDKCTSCNVDIFYSYRAENGKTGRHSAIASLK